MNKIKIYSLYLLLILLTFSYFIEAIDKTSQNIESEQIISELPKPPFQFKDNHIAVLIFKTTPNVLKQLVPKPMAPSPMNTMFIYFSKLTVHYKKQPYTYLEIAIGVPIILNGVIAYYYPILYLDRGLAITLGREYWGYNKKEGNINLIIGKKKIKGTLKRFGKKLIDFQFNIDKKLDPKTPEPNFPTYSLKIIPGIEIGSPPDIKQITSTTIRDKKYHKKYSGKGTVKFMPGVFDHLERIPVLEVLSGQYSISDMIFDRGKVIYDYLKK